jgi:hypothetical protein
MKFRLTFYCFLLVFCMPAMAQNFTKPNIIFSGSSSNDLYILLQKQGLNVKRFNEPVQALQAAREGDALFVVADFYPKKTVTLPLDFFQKTKQKKIKLYIEYSAEIPGVQIDAAAKNTELERGIVATTVFGPGLKQLSILGINDCYVLPAKVERPDIVLAKVAGLDKAEYGIDDVEKFPLLFEKDNMMIATTKLTNFATGRYGPDDAWKQVWSYILKKITGQQYVFKSWPSYVTPMYSRNQVLPANAKRKSVELGVEWFNKAKLYIDPSWKDMYLKYQGNGETPFGPRVDQKSSVGDGTMGLLEGHASKIYHDGTQQYRYWVRADVQGEAAFALAAAGNLLHNQVYDKKAKNLVDFMFYNSNLRSEERNDKKSPSYGLIGWSSTHPFVYYGDDNARAILGVLGASAFMKTDKWDKEVVEGILANFRTTGKYGYRGGHIRDKDLQKLGWEHYWNRDLIHNAPHFESWTWACYLWLYSQTGYKPLLEKTKMAIRMTMEAYPGKWKWTNGIQQERARMVLPLAWLVRIEDTAEHRKWLDVLVSKLLENQVESGAIREELGDEGKGRYGRTKSNADYGKHEAPLIFTNGDPIADMLYTSNFAFFSLNEAAHATGNKKYAAAVAKLSDFLTRIQVKSDRYRDLDGAWFRAFEYKRWEYWGSNADAGWGVWGTLSGWTQSWIVATQVLTEQNKSFWELTKKTEVKNYMQQTVDLMFNTKK